MFVVQIDFSHPEGKLDVDLISTLLATWSKSGQLIAYPQALAWVDSGIRVTGIAPERESLSNEHANKYARDHVAALRGAGVTIRTIVVGTHADGVATCECKAATDYVLFTSFLEDASPLRCGTCFGQVPLYRVPPPAGDEYLDLLGWQGDYQACDTLQMQCTVGERFGERQLGDVASPLSRCGRSLCAELETRTGARVFYYLLRMSSRPADAERRCPDCGDDWALDEKLHGRFDFRCEHCRLLGNVGGFGG